MSLIGIIQAIASVASVIKTVVAISIAAAGAFTLWIRKKAQQTEIDALRKAVGEAKNATSISDKAKAACDIEKSFNPDSTCDS